ncbi:uncharacterized protein [Erythrolamprus reginae]|uniref:uncharacterized protein n=1 Tax=Erythrolamprus reginae TaxID=121349 RepID=UPI00396CC670
MEARREFLQTLKVQLKQTFWLTEDSMAKLLAVGAKCVGAVTQQNDYYDTAVDDLAMAGLWLSRRDQEWFLIVESQEEGAQKQLEEEQTKEEAANMVLDPWESLLQDRTDNVRRDEAPVLREPAEEKTEETEAVLRIQPQQLDSKAVETEPPKLISIFTELVGESEISAYLAAHLRLDWNAEEQENITMEDFLEKAGIQHYASHRIVNQTTYRLSDRYTVTVQREEWSLRESATVVLEADVFNVCEGWEDMERLAAYLGFEEQGVQSERKYMT